MADSRTPPEVDRVAASRRAVAALSGEADLPLIGGLLRDLGGSVTVTVESRARAGVTPG